MECKVKLIKKPDTPQAVTGRRKKTMKKYGVLFVCTGNICRSPTAEGVFRHYVEERGLAGKFTVDSAGTHGYHIGEPPDRRAIATALARGIRIDDLRARQVLRKDFEIYDLILAMDSSHHDMLDNIRPPGEGGAKLSRFLDFVPEAGLIDVPDPYYGSLRDFEYVLDLIENGVEGLLARLEQEE